LDRRATRLLVFLSMVFFLIRTDTDKFSSEKNLSRNFFFEFLGESEDFVANYHRHLSENSDK